MSTLVYNQIFDELMQFFSSGKYYEEVKKGKEEFYKKVGLFDEKSEHFEIKMAHFVDWYLFIRPLKSGKKPMERIFKDYKVQEDQKVFYKNILSSRYSLFEFLKLKNSDVLVRDLFSGYKMLAKASPVVYGFKREEFFETRIIPHDDHFVFAPFFCIHPPQARKYILKEIKNIQKLKEEEQDQSRERFILKLFIMKYKHEQYKHLPLEEIYSNHSRLNVQP